MDGYRPVIDVVREIVAQGGCVEIPRKGFFEIIGPRHIGPLAATLTSRKDDPAVYDELCAILLGGIQHDPSSTLGRLARGLLKWRRGEMVIADGGCGLDLAGMANQLYAAIKDHAAGEPDEPTKALILAFKSLLAYREFEPTNKDWPKETCPAAGENPNKDIPERPAPGYVRGAPPPAEKKPSLYGKE